MRIQIIDLKVNNTKSLVNSLASIPDTEIKVCESVEECKSSNLTILPGIGKFGAVSNIMLNKGFDEYLKQIFINGDKILGICLGMQLLGSRSDESPGSSGLGIIPGVSKRLPSGFGQRIPNTGWASVMKRDRSIDFKSFLDEIDFYFVHSYFFDAEFKEDISNYSLFGEFMFPSVIYNQNVLGVQFHPEKSSAIGKKLLLEIRDWANE